MNLSNTFVIKWTSLLLLGVFSASSCTPPVPYHPHIKFTPPPSQTMRFKPSAFPPLTCEEECQDWGKEMKIAHGFAKECDFYRAITAYKRACFLLLQNHCYRRHEIQYDILLCYYLGNKYKEALEFFECSSLTQVDMSFPAYHDLLIILYDSIVKIRNCEIAKRFLPLIKQLCPETAKKLELSTAISEGNFTQAISTPGAPSYFKEAYCNYLKETKSVSKAKILNASLPGLGYWYVGQKNTALTAMLVNALFIAATYQFFKRGYYAAGTITGSLELGWYVGGIYGAARSAAEWNEQKYALFGEKIMGQECLYPQLMLRFAF